jgi:hypothetical protein
VLLPSYDYFLSDPDKLVLTHGSTSFISGAVLAKATTKLYDHISHGIDSFHLVHDELYCEMLASHIGGNSRTKCILLPCFADYCNNILKIATLAESFRKLRCPAVRNTPELLALEKRHQVIKFQIGSH